MRVWLINSAEPTPVDAGHWRLRRMGILAEELVNRGHEVLWWNSTFMHATKQQRYETDATAQLGPRYQIRFLRVPGYGRNVSLARIRNHRALGRKFRREAAGCPRPDVILSSYPTIELSREAVRYGRRHGVPTVLDVRDLWPDLFLDRLPWIARPAGRMALEPYFSLSRLACREATAICGTSPEFVEWGVRRAGRPATALDRDFPFGYSTPQFPKSQLEAARGFWRKCGVGVDVTVQVVCFFGALNHHFDMATVFEAARRVAARQRVQWVLCGDGERLAEYRQLAAGLPDVLLPGWVDAAQIWTLMERASFGLAPYVPSKNFLDNVANKPIEYLAGGLPILCSLERGALHRLVTQSTVGVPYDGSASKLAAAVLDSAAQPERYAELAKNARRLFAEKYEARQVYGDMAEYLASLAAPLTGRYDLRRAA